jgi:FtsZ-interacting cell division protein ZipA
MNLLPIHQWLQKLKGKKKTEILICAGVIAVVGVLFVSSFTDQKGQESAQGSVELSTVDSADEVEEKEG